MYLAMWNDIVLAKSEHTVQVEGTHYFPPEALRSEYFEASATTSQCAWKGSAEYYTIVGNGEVNRDAAWTYRNPTTAAEKIRGYIAFWKGVRVVETETSASPSEHNSTTVDPDACHTC